MLCRRFFAAVLLAVALAVFCFAVRLWMLRDELKDMGEELTGLLKELKKEEE